MAFNLQGYAEVWAADFEFAAAPGEIPQVICLVAWELRSGRKRRIWQDELRAMRQPPYPTDASTLFVAYYSSAEMGCHLALGWALPERVLDLYCEFRNRTNGLTTPCGWGLLGALAWYGLPSIEVAEKEQMRQLAQRGGPWTAEERAALLAYCESDVAALANLLPAMQGDIDLPRALLRGRYMKAAAHMESQGVPLDTETLARLRGHWGNLQDRLIAAINQDYGVYEGRCFKVARFAEFLVRQDIPWPRLASGGLDLRDETFRDLARVYPILTPLRDLRVALSQMRLTDLAVGQDGRNRLLLSAFASRTGRNQPSNTRFIFGPSVWLRSLIRPTPGWGLAYVDYSQQEYAIAGALSGDALMMAGYQSGDPYLEFARQAGLVPADATKDSHPVERDQCKQAVLAVQYGMGAESLALRLGQPILRAKELLRLHRETYRTFWRWVDGAVDYAMLQGKLWTVFGWTIQVSAQVNPRFLQNFLMQSNGSEMLRLACCRLTEAGIRVCAPIHDAVLVEAPLDMLEDTVATTQRLMAEASAEVLGGFRLRSDAKLIRYPDRYRDPRGESLWRTVMALLAECDPLANPGTGAHPTGAPVQQHLGTDAQASPLISF